MALVMYAKSGIKSVGKDKLLNLWYWKDFQVGNSSLQHTQK
jgi:hypothetical protein